MTTALEDRLSAALHARADVVQPEDLWHLTLPGPASRPSWRRPVVVALVAAAAVAAVALPVVLAHHGTHEHPLPSDRFTLPPNHVPSTRFPAPLPESTQALTGDIDGDGRADQARVVGHTLTVTLAADPGHPLTGPLGVTGLIGLTGTDGPGAGIVTTENDSPGEDSWQVMVLQNGALARVPPVESSPAAPAGSPPGAAAGSLGVTRGYSTSWLTPTGELVSGVLDPMQQGQRHLAVYASRVVVRSGHLHVLPIGRRCWDVVTQQVPAPCPAGVDDAFDPGPHGSLPALLPKSDLNDSINVGETWQQDPVSLTLTKDPVHAASDQNQVYDVVGTIAGHHVSAPVGTWLVGLMKRYVDLGHGVHGLAPFSIGEGGWDWHLMAYVDGRLVPLPVAGDPHPGPFSLRPGADPVVADGKGHAGSTWISPGGRVFTTVSLGDQGYVELYEWQVTDSSGTELRAVDLGEVCMDSFWGTYGTCRS
jgi:hypothetical protein